jgi:GcrA cell cycle regulator
MNFIWSEDRTAKAKSLWLSGHSAEEIAQRLGGGISRSAVCGKMHRMGLAKGNRKAPAAPREPKVPRAPKPLSAPAAPKMKRGPGEHRTAPKSANVNPWGASSPVEAAQKRAKAETDGRARLNAFAMEPANDDAIPLIGRPFGFCAWPVGTPDKPANQMCCGQRNDPGSSMPYCARHRAIASNGRTVNPTELARSIRRFG